MSTTPIEANTGKSCVDLDEFESLLLIDVAGDMWSALEVFPRAYDGTELFAIRSLRRATLLRAGWDDFGIF